MLDSHSSLKTILSGTLEYFRFHLVMSEYTEYLTSQRHRVNQKHTHDRNPKIPFKGQAFSHILGSLPNEITGNIVYFAIKMAFDPGLCLDTISETLSLTSPYKLYTFHLCPSTLLLSSVC